MTSQAEAGPMAEICICAAVRAKSGLIVRCHRHRDGIRTIADIPDEKIDRHPGAQGFITSRNRFVGREEALQLQKAAGIESVAPGGYRGSRLYSEDLY